MIARGDENSLVSQVGEESTTMASRSSGSAEIKTAGDRVQVSFCDFWQRWPKGLETRPGHLRFDFLPQQSEAYGKNLPDHLRFPFVEGRYRLKWGMAFTERLSFDFQAKEPLKALSTALNTPLQAILPVAYTAATGAFGTLSASDTPLSKSWNDFMNRSLELHRQQREKQREYGYLNWGDWYGERGRNWGNNEYDRSHAFYIGANPQHSIGHTGISYQLVIPKTWTYQYDHASSAGNGHTWADGMADCWLVTGDPVVMESLIALGEHIRWAFVPQYKSIGTHERSAGWSIQAALATYRATSDPEYLKAADKIAQLAIKEWDKETGIWPHPLPAPHAGGRTGVIGNSVYNIGVLLMGLSKYHEQTQNPEVLECMNRACEWVAKSWKEERAWPYSAAADGTQLVKTSL